MSLTVGCLSSKTAARRVPFYYRTCANMKLESNKEIPQLYPTEL